MKKRGRPKGSFKTEQDTSVIYLRLPNSFFKRKDELGLKWRHIVECGLIEIEKKLKLIRGV